MRARLNRLRLRVPRGGDVGRRVAERLAGFVGKLLVLRAHLADGVMPAVVPVDAGLAVNHGPSAVARSRRLASVAVGLEGGVEIASVALAQFPLAHEAGPIGGSNALSGFELNTRDIRGGNPLLAAIFENDCVRHLEFNARHIGHVEVLPVPVLKDEHDRFLIAGSSSAGLRETAGRGKHKYNEYPSWFHSFAHSFSPLEPRA